LASVTACLDGSNGKMAKLDSHFSLHVGTLLSISKSINLVIPCLTRNPAKTNVCVQSTPLDTSFRWYDEVVRFFVKLIVHFIPNSNEPPPE
jgi:hypothetical protein